jgi:hypothetical protein
MPVTILWALENLKVDDSWTKTEVLNIHVRFYFVSSNLCWNDCVAYWGELKGNRSYRDLWRNFTPSSGSENFKGLRVLMWNLLKSLLKHTFSSNWSIRSWWFRRRQHSTWKLACNVSSANDWLILGTNLSSRQWLQKDTKKVDSGHFCRVRCTVFTIILIWPIPVTTRCMSANNGFLSRNPIWPSLSIPVPRKVLRDSSAHIIQ